MVRITKRISRKLQRSFTRFRIGIIQGVRCSEVVFTGNPIIQVSRGSNLTIGPRSHLISDAHETALGVNHPVVLRTLRPGARIVIGADVGISGGSICAANQVEIGNATMLGANTVIVDTDFHPIHSSERRYAGLPASADSDLVTIGRNVFVGTGAIILRGTQIGDNSVVGAGAVVKGIFPNNVIIAGNPARIVAPVRVQS